MTIQRHYTKHYFYNISKSTVVPNKAHLSIDKRKQTVT